MKVHLVYEYTVKEDDGVGTEYDALIVATRQLESDMARAPSNDDLADVFKEFTIL